MRTLLTLWIVVGLIALLAIASMLPFSVYVRGAKDEGFSYQTTFYWPWQSLGVGMRRDAQGRYVQLLCRDRCLYERERRKKKPKKPKKKEKKKKGPFNLLRDRKLLSQLIKAGSRLLRDLFLCFRRPRLVGDVEIGFADPAVMGVVSGFLYAVSPSGMMLDDLKIRPNYVDAVFTGKVTFKTDAQPARIMVVFIKLIFRLPIRELLRLLRRRKRAAKEKEVSQNGF